MTSAKNSTGASERYSGLNLSSLNLEALQLTVPRGSVTATTGGPARGGQQPATDSAQREQRQAEEGMSESVLLPPSEASMQDYYELQHKLLGLTVAFGAVIFPFIWGFYSLQIALDYVLGACGGIVYLRMLGRSVSTIGRQAGRQKNSNAGRLAVFAALMIVALRWEQLDVIPVFLGFLTYKAAIIGFVLWTSFKPQREVA